MGVGWRQRFHHHYRKSSAACQQKIRRQLPVNLISISSAVNDLQSSRLPAVRERRGADSTDCWVLGKASSSKLWFTEMRRRTPWLSCLSRNLNVTDRWVITAWRSWQADEREKVELQENKGLVSGEDTAPGRRTICLLVAADGSASQNKICTMTSSIRREYFIPEMTFSPEVARWSLEDYVCVCARVCHKATYEWGGFKLFPRSPCMGPYLLSEEERMSSKPTP